MTAYELISSLSDKYRWKEDVLSLIQTHPEINKRQQFNFAYEVLSLEPIKLLNNYDWRGIINNLKHKENPKFVKRENKPEPKPVIFDLLEGLNRNTKWKADAIAFAEKEIEHIKMLNIDTLAKFTNIQGLRTELPQYNWDTIKYNFTRKEKWNNSNVSETVKVPEEIVTEDPIVNELLLLHEAVEKNIESKGKTPKEWFESLPDSCEWKQKALDNHFKWTNGGKKEYNPSLYSTLSEVLQVAFYWRLTPEGHDYWDNIREQIKRDEEKQLEAVQGYDTISNFVWTPEKDVLDTYESLVENNFSKLSPEVIQKAFDKHGVKQAVKDSAGKISFKEIDPEFICLMARRMNSNKIQFGGKYEEFNYQKDINVLDLIDATERHLVDLKLLLQGRSPILNPSESELQHIASVSCNMMMIFYSINEKAQTIGQE